MLDQQIYFVFDKAQETLRISKQLFNDGKMKKENNFQYNSVDQILSKY